MPANSVVIFDWPPPMLLLGALAVTGVVVVVWRTISARRGGDAPDAPRCLSCGYPWPGNAAVCPECGKRPGFEAVPQDRGEVATLAECLTESEAEMIAAAVRSEGIRVQVAGGTVAGYRAEVPAIVRVLVRPEDHARAAAIVDEARRSAAAVDWDRVDVGETTEEPGKP